jgi:hypothetical protein
MVGERVGDTIGGKVVEIIIETAEEKRPREMVLDVPEYIPRDTA